ncbi:MAG: EpsG family protein [Lachnospiraceae bacterium]
MLLYLLITAVTLALAAPILTRDRIAALKRNNPSGYIGRRQGVSILCLGAVFTVLFLLSALRLEVGNDYGTYVDVIHEIYVGGYVVTEPLFNALVKGLCFLSGGENYLLVFALFAFITVWLFLKVLYEQSDSFFFSFFLFMTLGIYFRTFNTVRYYLVLAMSLYSFRYVLRKEYIKFLILIGFAALFHKSVLVVLAFYPIAAFSWKKWHIALMTALGCLAMIFQQQIVRVALFLYPSYRNTIYLETESGIGENLLTIVRCIAVLLLALMCFKDSVKESERNCFYFQLNLLAIGLYCFASFLPLVGRLGYYLITSHVLFIPSLLMGIEEKKKKRILTSVVIASCLLYFLLFLWTADQEGVRVLPYKSWLFYEKDFLNAGEIF